MTSIPGYDRMVILLAAMFSDLAWLVCVRCRSLLIVPLIYIIRSRSKVLICLRLPSVVYAIISWLVILKEQTNRL